MIKKREVIRWAKFILFLGMLTAPVFGHSREQDGEPAPVLVKPTPVKSNKKQSQEAPLSRSRKNREVVLAKYQLTVDRKELFDHHEKEKTLIELRDSFYRGAYDTLERQCNKWILLDPIPFRTKVFYGNFYLSAINLYRGNSFLARLYLLKARNLIDRNEEIEKFADYFFMLEGEINFFDAMIAEEGEQRQEYLNSAFGAYEKAHHYLNNHLSSSNKGERFLIQYQIALNYLNLAHVETYRQPDQALVYFSQFEELKSGLENNFEFEAAGDLPDPGLHRLEVFYYLYSYHFMIQQWMTKQRKNATLKQLNEIESVLDSVMLAADAFEKQNGYALRRPLFLLWLANGELAWQKYELTKDLKYLNDVSHWLEEMLTSGSKDLWAFQEAMHLSMRLEKQYLKLFEENGAIISDLALPSISLDVEDELLSVTRKMIQNSNQFLHDLINRDEQLRTSKAAADSELVDLGIQKEVVEKTKNNLFLYGVIMTIVIITLALLGLIWTQRKINRQREKAAEEIGKSTMALHNLAAKESELREKINELDKRKEELNVAGEENRMLRQELSHRIRNHLLAITSSIEMEMQDVEVAGNQIAVAALTRTIERTRKVLTLHTLLDEKRGEGIYQVSLKQYVQKVWENLTASISILPDNITTDLQLFGLRSSEIPIYLAKDIGNILTEWIFITEPHFFGEPARRNLNLSMWIEKGQLHFCFLAGVGNPQQIVDDYQKVQRDMHEDNRTHFLSWEIVNAVFRKYRGRLVVEAKSEEEISIEGVLPLEAF